LDRNNTVVSDDKFTQKAGQSLMAVFNTIKSKFIFNLFSAVTAVLISVIVAYFIATNSIHDIMTNDLLTVANTLEQNVNYIAKIEPKAYQEDDFKNGIKSIKIGESGYVYFLMPMV
jgi:methyl-accepting chemotaxis protein